MTKTLALSLAGDAKGLITEAINTIGIKLNKNAVFQIFSLHGMTWTFLSTSTRQTNFSCWNIHNSGEWESRKEGVVQIYRGREGIDQMERMLERSRRCRIVEQCSRDGRNGRGGEVGVTGVHGGGVSKEAILVIRPLLLIYEDSWSSVKIKELHTVSMLSP